MPDQTTATQQFQESLAALAAAGGVELQKARPGKPGGADQLFHTPNDSRPASFAGSVEEKLDEEDDGINEAGTAYLAKSLQQVQADIGAKLEKGADVKGTEIDLLRGIDPSAKVKAKMAKAGEKGELPRITKAERWALEFSKAGGKFEPVKDDEENEKKDDEKKEMAKASLRSFVASVAPAARASVDASPVLVEMVKSQTLGFQALLQENALLKAQLDSLQKAVASERDEGTKFRKALSTTIVELGQQTAATADLLASLAGAPSGGPRSQMRDTGAPVAGIGSNATVLQKGGAGAAPDIKQQILGPMRKAATAVMLDMVKAKQLNPKVVSMFEGANQLPDDVAQAVHQQLMSRAGAR